MFAIATSLKSAAAPKPRFAAVLSPEGLKVADAFQLLLSLMHKKNPFLNILYFLQVPALCHPE